MALVPVPQPQFDDLSILETVGKITYVRLPTPSLGGKGWLLKGKGIFVLEEGPGMVITMACTHAGSGSIDIVDGVPDASGFYPEPLIKDVSADGYWQQPGIHKMLTMCPSVMGSWMLSAGFYHGLTIHAEGGTDSAAVIATIVWMPEAKPKQAAPKAAAAAKTSAP